jgi:hypothetical protein
MTTTEPTIQSVTAETLMGYRSFTGQMSDGTIQRLFGYYIDELSFAAQELVGLTAEQAGDLFHRRDVAYLRS